jgi:hypothetical protein
MSMRDEMRQLGYSKEDEYFFKKDRELLDKMREAANARKKAMEEKNKDQPFWMKCPKCGQPLQEEVLEDVVRVDNCAACGGTYFDRGELDLLIKTRISTMLRTS